MLEHKHSVKKLHLIMGQQCNARCIMCYQSDYTSNHNMPTVIWKDHLASLYPGLQSVKIQGGEPTIMSNCKEFAEHVRSYPNIKLIITTNGIKLSDFWKETFIEQGGHINFSLNAAKPDTYNQIVKFGNYENVTRNIRYLVTNRKTDKPSIAISAVILKQNIAEIRDFITLGCELGVNRVDFIIDPVLSFSGLPDADVVRKEINAALELLAHTGMQSEGLETLANRFQVPVSVNKLSDHSIANRTCPIPFKNLLVDEKGNVRVCCVSWKIIGNTYDSGLIDILIGSKLNDFQKKVTAGNYIWCDPYCPDNPKPHKAALLSKYFYLAKSDPATFFKKIIAKLQKV